MNLKSYLATVALLFACRHVNGQGTFLYDQQSSTNPAAAGGGGPELQHVAPPYGQSFTPGFASIEFIQLGFRDVQPGNGVGATVYVNLRSYAIDGPIMASTAPVHMLDGWGIVGNMTNFFFGTPVSLTPGQVYYFQPVVQSGDLWEVSAGEFNYPGGSAFAGGVPASGSDYWFREGVVPEPCSALLMIIGAAAFTCLRPRRATV